jgi:hypothetical protein
MRDEKTVIDDSWVLNRTGHFSPSFSSFLLQIAPDMPEKNKKELQKVDRILGPHGVDELGIPEWVKPFASKILQKVSQRVSSKMAKVADKLFSTGIFSLSDALYDVAKERGIKSEAVLRLVKMLPEFEALMYYLNVRKYYRDHCAHQLRVAILGDYLLDLESDAGRMEGLIKEKLDFSSEELRTAWWFAGLLHDTGIPLAKLCTAVNWSLLNEILRCYTSLDIEASPMSISLSGGKLKNREYLSVLMGDMPQRWQQVLENGLGIRENQGETMFFNAGFSSSNEYQPKDLRVDHGVVGAVNLLRTVGTPERLRKNLPEDRPLIEAARAIAVHNFKKELGNVPFEDYPLAFLLILTDELQEWSRPIPVPIKETYFTTSLEKATLLDEIFYEESDELWDVPYTNMQAKKIAGFDFDRLCRDKKECLGILDCTEAFPESQVQLRNANPEKPKEDEKYSIEIKTK